MSEYKCRKCGRKISIAVKADCECTRCKCIMEIVPTKKEISIRLCFGGAR